MVFKIESKPRAVCCFFWRDCFPSYGHCINSEMPLGPWPLSNRAALHISTLGHMKTERLLLHFFFFVGKISVNRGRHSLGYQHRNRMSRGNFEARLRMGSLSSTPSKKENKMVTSIFACNCNPPSLAGQSLITDHPLSLSGVLATSPEVEITICPWNGDTTAQAWSQNDLWGFRLVIS
jgi:hypothetical protein